MDSNDNKPLVQKPQRSDYFKNIAVVLLVLIAFGFGYQTGHKGFVFVPKTFQVINQKDQPQTVDYDLLWKALDAVDSKYIDKESINKQNELYGSVKGAIDSIGDPYTTFFPPEQKKSFDDQLRGSFGGIGAEVGKKDGNIVIIAPIENTPASKAGLLAGDIIYQVDGKSTQDWSVDFAVSKIRGPKGTQVTISILRKGKDKPFDVKLIRDTIVIKSVKWSYKEQNGKTIAVISLSEFGDDSKALFNQAVNELLGKNVSGIIIDLRNNPGGYLQTAVSIASNWVKAGDLVVSEAHSDGSNIKYTGEGNPRLANIKTVVLINGGSASASEILSGALRDHGFAKLVGEKSFGKGSVQELVNLPGGSAVKVTIAKWITPGGVNLNHNGLEPDIKVGLTAEEVSAGKDPQMDAALGQFSK